MRGGYKMIDFKDVNLTSGGDSVKIDGIYESIESNYRKPIMIINGTVNGVERFDTMATVVHSSDSYDIYYGNPQYHINVTNDDMVSLVHE